MDNQPNNDLIRELYARFGLAYYQSECLHRGLCIIFAWSELPAPGLITRPRIEERLAQAFSLTLGDVATKLEGILPTELSGEVRGAVDKRNFLAHHFWFERAHFMFSADKVHQLLNELDEYAESFERIDVELDGWSEPMLQRLGLTKDLLEDSMRRILAGESEQPLPDKQTVRALEKKLDKRQQLTRVWEFTLADGKKPLVFELADGSLWQLCDVGLGWTAYKEAGPDWKEQAVITPHLPADILPRPKSTAPWEYEFTLARGAVLWVKPGTQNRTFKWGIRKP